ncbi:competence type IV pilus major pilin ComGC [Oceanobacillus halotolerans]|uniref:competence type IV pilus major pilin ComGC n=1 Tax=Oceanobacillus halotolerans TaxID=2663380 RepID=UPI0013D936FC|nr:prepilin-type N-terminal cleavage/methylation domain-containing protein [Oceanobacillus halotolerans]
MWTRMKAIMKQQKGFTLVELLTVIAILGIIVAIAVPTIGNIIGESEEDAHEANVQLIENAAKLAAVSEGESDTSYSLNDLVENGYLESIPEDVGDYTYDGEHTVSISGSVAEYDEYSD